MRLKVVTESERDMTTSPAAEASAGYLDCSGFEGTLLRGVAGTLAKDTKLVTL